MDCHFPGLLHGFRMGLLTRCLQAPVLREGKKRRHGELQVMASHYVFCCSPFSYYVRRIFVLNPMELSHN
jgi:hypothetical protein